MKNSPSEVTSAMAKMTIVPKVIFWYLKKCYNYKLLLNFHERIGVNLIECLRNWLLVMALLLLKLEYFWINTWILENGTEARKEKVVITRLVPTWWIRNGPWRRSSTIICWGSSRSQSVLFLINYILTFQAGLLVAEVPFKEEEEDDEPEPLGMEHYYFPLGLWLVGLLLSALCLVAEIIIKRRGNQK